MEPEHEAGLPGGAEWWVHQGDESFGPYSMAQMQGFVTEGRVIAETPVRRTDEPDWRPAAQHPVFAPLFSALAAEAVRPAQTREEAPDLTGVPGGPSAAAVGPVGVSGHDVGRQPLPPGETTTMAHVVYGLFVLGTFTVGLAAIIGLIIALLKRRDVRGTWLETHYQWQIRTFWVLLLGWVVAAILFRYAIGVVLPFLLMLWALWRLIKGWVRLGSSRAIDDPSTWF